jgi:hypothetical protein
MNTPAPDSTPEARVPPATEKTPDAGTANEPAFTEPVVAVNDNEVPAVTDTPAKASVEEVNAIEPETVAPELASRRAVVAPGVSVAVVTKEPVPLRATVPAQLASGKVKGVPMVVVSPTKGPLIVSGFMVAPL